MSTMDRVKEHPRVAHAYHDEDGFWAELKPGWVCIHSGAHTCHEDTATALLAAVKDAELCKSPDCCPKATPTINVGPDVLLPCPLPRTVKMTVRLGECNCVPRPLCGLREAAVLHDSMCRSLPIRVTCSIGGETWAGSEVVEWDAPIGFEDVALMHRIRDVCRERWEIVKALVTGEPLGRRGADSVDAGIALVELFSQRDAVFAALAAKVRVEQADDATTRDLVRLIPELRVPDVARATAEDYLSAMALRRYVSHLIAKVGGT